MLTKTETKIVRLLAKATSIRNICAALDISPACFYTHRSNIRQKTGFNPKYPTLCRDWLAAHPEEEFRKNAHLAPTPMQIQCLTMYSEGKDKWQIHRELKIGPETVYNHIYAGALRAGIRRQVGKDHRQQVREWLASRQSAPTMDDPMFS